MPKICDRPSALSLPELHNFVHDETLPAHERIGAVYHRILSSRHREEVPQLLNLIGVSPNDHEAARELEELLHTIHEGQVKITPSPEDTGVYFLKNGDRKVAVFKIGRKRAATELFARRFSALLGLEKHMIPGLFCAIECLQFQYDPEEQEEPLEQLWNGPNKVYLPQKSSAAAVVGIIERFISDDSVEEESLLDFAKKTMFALAIGLRDGKEDGEKGSKFFDVDDSMPVWIDVPEDVTIEHVPAATHMPYLSHPYSTKKLSEEAILALKQIVDRWSPSEILEFLLEQKISFRDRVAEAVPITSIEEDASSDSLDSDASDESTCSPAPSAFLDEGKCMVRLEWGDKHPINGYLSIPPTTDQMFTRAQRDACLTRCSRIREFINYCIRENRVFSPLELVCAVDKYYGAHSEHIRKTPLSRQADRIFHGGAPDALARGIGIYSPTGSDTPISAEILRQLPRSPSSTPIRPMDSVLRRGSNEFAPIEPLTSPKSKPKGFASTLATSEMLQHGDDFIGGQSDHDQHANGGEKTPGAPGSDDGGL